MKNAATYERAVEVARGIQAPRGECHEFDRGIAELIAGTFERELDRREP